MEDQRTLTAIGILGVSLFLIGAILGVLLNLVSGDLADWYSENHTLALSLTGALIIVGSMLTFVSVWLSSRRGQEASRVNEADRTTPINAKDALMAVYEAYKVSPGDKVSSETIRHKLGLSEQEVIDLIAKLEGRGFIKAKWVERKALLTITEDGILVGKSLIGQ